MANDIKPLVIKVQPKSVPNGVQNKWNDFSTQMPTFTREIITPPIDDNNGFSVQIGAVVSGMPTIFARANMFKLALNYVDDKKQSETGLMSFYSSLVDEWRGFIGCLALDYANVKAERIYLQYSDGKGIADTENIYEPKGAFGNLLFDRKPLWCDQGLAANQAKIPFIDVITYKNIVVGGTSPESFLFTSVSYKITDEQPFVGVLSGKFTDPLKSELTQEQLLQLHGYVTHIVGAIPKFDAYYKRLDESIRLNSSNLLSNLNQWLREIESYAESKNIQLEGSIAPPVDVFNAPFKTLFNHSSELYGEEGVIFEDEGELKNAVKFDPRKLLLDKRSEIARIDYGNDAMRNSDFIKQNPIYVMKAEILGMPGTYYYFALPLSPLGLNVFGKNLAALVGMDENSAIRSRLTATFDPTTNSNNLKVKLQLVTQEGKENNLEEVYSVGQNAIRGNDVIIWPNFISKQWKRYFMYSEIPHNTTSQSCPFKATPFVGNVDDEFFRILMDGQGNPIYLAEGEKISVPDRFKDRLKVHLHVISDKRVADNQYKYEIYESNQPFKGIRLTNANRESGFVIIRYGSGIEGFPVNELNAERDLGEARLGIDFGSTNTSVAYYSDRNTKTQGMKFKNRRVSLFGESSNDNKTRPAIEDEIYFFQDKEIDSNSIKSILTIHDTKRIVQEDFASQEMLAGQPVKGGFPCFESNIPIESVSDRRYKLKYPRSGMAEIVYNMKWSNQDLENAHKKAFIGSLLLHIYAQLFTENLVPTKLNWSYPSSMSSNLVGKYNQIWSGLSDVNPINDPSGRYSLHIMQAPGSFHYDAKASWGKTTPSNTWGKQMPQTSGLEQKSTWGNPSSMSSMTNWGKPMSQPTTLGSGQPTPQSSASGWGQSMAKQGTNGWGHDKPEIKTININLDKEPVHFDFKPIENDKSMTEACAVANYTAHLQGSDTSNSLNLTLCFDVGGSTTDISALCSMKSSGGGTGMAMVKQNSIRFAAQRVSSATRYSKKIKDVLIQTCADKNYRIQGLNVQPFKFSADMAPYYFDQILDRLEDSDFPAFYNSIRAKCPELMSVNIYVTGLIMFYAGQLSYKLLQEIKKSPDRNPAFDYDWRPKVNIVLAGKGARIFDWFDAIDSLSSKEYYMQQFILGYGGSDRAFQDIQDFAIVKSNDVKYEVSMGLAYPPSNNPLLIPKNSEAIEILGEDGFIVLNSQGQRIEVPYDANITPEMMQYIGSYFINAPKQDLPCPKFMDFSLLFYQVATQLFGLNMTQNDFWNGFSSMNINNYIKNLPEYYDAVQNVQPDRPFDFVAPIIILEGMKFYDDFLLPGIQK